MTDRFKPPSQKVSTPVILVDPATGEAYTSAAPLPVSATVEPPEGGATEAKQDAAIVVLGDIKTAAQLIDNAISGNEMQVDVVAALPAGTNNIGDVDVLTVPADPFGVNADVASATGSISAKLRFIASTGIPVTGTVTVAGAVTNAGTFAVQESGAALTALQLIDNAVSGDGFNITQFAGAAVPIGAGGEATALRVTLATDSTGVVSIDDNGGAITVDYATTGSGTAAGALRVELPTDGTGVIATVGAVTAITNALPAGTNAIGKLAANSGVDIGDVDVLSVIPGTGATNLGKAEDAAHASGDTGVMALAVRTDTAASRAGTDGDYTPLITDSLNKLWVTGTYLTDAAAGASDQVVPAGAIRDDALAALTPVDGDYDRLRVDKWGRLHVRESLDEYETVAASQSTQSLGATGAAGDILSHVVIIPATTSPGAVSIKDGSNAAITIFAGGAASVQTLIPFTVPLGLRSTQGAWQITTGADVSAIGVGDFT